MSRSHGPTTPTRARGRQSREETGSRSRRTSRPPQRQAPLTGAERGRYLLRRTGHFLLMAVICVLINILVVIVVGGIAYVVYSLTK
jgi:hypothetical protein